MRFNWRPKSPAFIDFETQSECDLEKATASQYAKHPTTRVLTCVVKVGAEIHEIGPYLDGHGRELLSRIARDHTLVAHNAPFDESIWRAAGLPEAEWFDTLPCARAAGYPGKLDDLGLIITGEGKDHNGSRLIDLLCKVRNGKVPVVGPAHRLLMDYNVRDVELLEAVYERVKGFGEPDVMTVDRRINERGIPIDRGYAEALLEAFREGERVNAEVFAAKTGNVNPRSTKQMKEWLEKQGFLMDSINKPAYAELLSDPDKFYMGEDDDPSAALVGVQEVMELRRELARVGKSKMETALSLLEEDGRVRDQLVYYGAGPGRWSSRRLQVHNFPATTSGHIHVLGVEPTYANVMCVVEEVRERAARGEIHLDKPVAVADVMNTMVRHMIRAEWMNVADYAAVEARCLAWISGEERLLSVYQDPTQSVYLDMGERVFGRRLSKKDDPHEYSVAKALVLASGYGMSGSKFRITCKLRDVSTAELDRIGITPEQAVKIYRESYPGVPKLWHDFSVGCKEVVKGGGDRVVGRCLLTMVGGDLHMVLPSGRPIVYRDAAVEMVVPAYCKLYNMPEVAVPTVTYLSPKYGGKHRTFLYGGKSTENACQGICRDVMAVALVEFERAGLDPFLHVHDDAATESGPERHEEHMEIMSAPPTWAPGFPVLVEGYSGPVWTKTPKGYRETVYMCGRKVSDSHSRSLAG